jgi:hypothetical protein
MEQQQQFPLKARQGSIPHLSHHVGLIGYAIIAKRERIKVT